MACLHKSSFSASLLGVGNLEYAVVRKSAKMIGSLFLLNRQCPTVKQRTTAVIHNAKLMLYNNGKTLFGKTYITFIFIYLNLIVAAPEIRAALTQL